MRSCLPHPARHLQGTAPTVTLSAALAASCGAMVLTASSTPDRSSTDRSPMVQVGAVLVVTHPISASALATMRAVAGEIWNRHGVRIHWRTPGPQVEPKMNLVVLVSRASGRCAPSRALRERPLGCFPAHHDGDDLPVVTILPDHARRLVHEAFARLCQHCPEGWLEHHTAMLLGRALAHELGHYLLGPQHTPTGLMRASVRKGDLLTPGRNAFSLTDAQLASLRKPRPRTGGR